MPSLEMFLESRWDHSASLRAPLHPFVRATRVARWNEAMTIVSLSLEPDIATVVMPDSSTWDLTRKPSVPNPKEKTTLSLAEKSYVLLVSWPVNPLPCLPSTF